MKYEWSANSLWILGNSSGIADAANAVGASSGSEIRSGQTSAPPNLNQVSLNLHQSSYVASPRPQHSQGNYLKNIPIIPRLNEWLKLDKWKIN